MKTTLNNELISIESYLLNTMNQYNRERLTLVLQTARLYAIMSQLVPDYSIRVEQSIELAKEIILNDENDETGSYLIAA